MKFHSLPAALLFLVSIYLVGCDTPFVPNQETSFLLPKTADEDATVPSIKVNQVIIHAESFGSPKNPMLVVLHGGPGEDYRYLLRFSELASLGYYIVFYDQRGTGLSQRLNSDYYDKPLTEVMNDFYNDFEGVVAHFRASPTQPVYVFGHSWGAMLISAYMNDRGGNKLKGVLLHEPGGLRWDDIMAYEKRGAKKPGPFSERFSDVTFGQQFMTAPKNDHQLLDYLAAAPYIEAQAANEPVLLWRPGAVHSAKMYELGNRYKPDWTTNLKKYPTGVLLTYGSESSVKYPDEYAQKVADFFGDATLVKINGIGHEMSSKRKAWEAWLPHALKYLNEIEAKK